MKGLLVEAYFMLWTYECAQLERKPVDAYFISWTYEGVQLERMPVLEYRDTQDFNFLSDVRIKWCI